MEFIEIWPLLVLLVPFLALILHFIRHRLANGGFIFVFHNLQRQTSICVPSDMRVHKPRARTISLEGNDEIHTQWQQGHITLGRVVLLDDCLIRIIGFLRLIRQCEIAALEMDRVGNWRYEIARIFFALRGCDDKPDPGVFFWAVLDDDEVYLLFKVFV